ncbi:protein phosphatase 1L isoform X2 [Monomorium pharaonis]|nr:protein phosphatase 1L isoform X2 [Monomorium pharaonis]XP_036148098.1 protein phosphatase 1L isoform X2 [Monomorium pharaonis]XP_036148104.1 protein phosphatase 1L isoform X2 [Monomorium pharaonis]XP_036148114.1 protein phosphatase 1L isoform X2 [Monomorium pharaonis]XP_036148118.1 protein phosphatase 1L isoform X2 [Monomorium pharaonis]
MKLMSKFAVNIPTGLNTGINSPLSYFCRIMRIYALKPEVLICGMILAIILFYIQAVDIWSRALLGKIQYTLGRTTSKVSTLKFLVNDSVNVGMKVYWELKQDHIAAYAVQGHRARMEDRFVVNEDINNTGISVFAIFDGHGGEFAADYARDKLISNINKKVIELKNLLAGKASAYQEPILYEPEKKKDVNKEDENHSDRKKSFRKVASTSLTDDCVKKKAIEVTDPELLDKLDSITPITREVRPRRPSEKKVSKIDVINYIEGNKINYGRLLTDEVLAVDRLLVETAKKNMDVAGTTALIALLEDSKLIVANVGDSRGVMCDEKGNAIPLSFDHKPQQERERRRINKAGGLVTFNGVWRVAGILATSRALGDYPLKDKKLVIADPDILTFDLNDHNPMFIILASDGLWDTFSNEEAVAFIKEHINEPHFGAKSIALQSFYRGSADNITVVVINLKDRKFSIPEARRNQL